VGTVLVKRELGDVADDWARLAHRSASPFVTYEWLSCWWNAFGRGEPTWMLLRGDDGSLEAGTLFEAKRRNALSAAANVHSGDWDAVARNEKARRELWEALGDLGATRISLLGIPEQAGRADSVEASLQRAGYRVIRTYAALSPWLALPASWEELMQRISKNMRSQLRRRQRALEREGTLAFRTVTEPAVVDEELEAFLELEASGWKGRAGTAITSDRRTDRCYREFARAAAERGWLRLYSLELDGKLIASDYGCSFAGGGFLIKTAFSEAHERFSPGLVLRGKVLQAAIEEGLTSYDFLGGPERYKQSWTSEVHPRTRIWAYRGTALPRYAYRSRVYPVLRDRIGPAVKLARDQARRLRRQRWLGDRSPRLARLG
jgi:CelD/BcsL family acetyltransferase involved in cellulose biosynthesis